MLLCLQRYNLNVMYKPGKEICITDALKEEKEDLLGEELNGVSSQLPISKKKLEVFKKATAEDAEMQALRNAVRDGWSIEKSALLRSIQPHWILRDEISYGDGMFFKANKLIVPQQLRQEMLSKIHESHLGIVKCKERGRDIMYWPNMLTQIEETVSKCMVCNENNNNNLREPLMPHEFPGRPWDKIGTEIFYHGGSTFLLCVDYFSKYPEIRKLNDTTSLGVILQMKSIFARHAIPDVIVSDNGPQYASAEFAIFADEWDFNHVTSSPGHTQSNGQAEWTVQTVKTLLKKSQSNNSDPYVALLEYRNSPVEGIGLSPAQLLMGRCLRMSQHHLCCLHLMPWKKCKKSSKNNSKQKFYYDRQTKLLPDLGRQSECRKESPGNRL